MNHLRNWSYGMMIAFLNIALVRSFQPQQQLQLKVQLQQPIILYAQLQPTVLPSSSSRRAWIQQIFATSCTTAATVGMTLLFPLPASCAGTDNKNSDNRSTNDIISALQGAQSTLDVLLSNWQRATVECNYADVPRDLLSAENKQLLLEKASTYALFDKSVSVESCKTTNRLVRDYIGVTGKGPMVGIEKKLRKALDLVDPDHVEDYVVELESFSQCLAKASSLSYMAGTADFDSINNFDKASVSSEATSRNQGSNLEQSRRAIQECKTSLDRMLGLLMEASST